LSRTEGAPYWPGATQPPMLLGLPRAPQVCATEGAAASNEEAAQAGAMNRTTRLNRRLH
jgi:hypothetical protein